jgi:uncharacterized hydrophobic protein (TIGR00271 family)
VVTSVTQVDIEQMRDQVFFEGPERKRRLSRYWLLLLLSAVIATAGVVSDSTATVIGAMIIAPLMTPILGWGWVVLTDRANLGRCLLLLAAGAAAVVVVSWLLGHVVPYPVVAATNSQVAARVTPRLVDLVAALATGAVGSVALARPDISDTLPGVAIAISLVPPLAVAGLTLQSGAPGQCLGALLLFATNVAAILASGSVVMALYRVGKTTIRQSNVQAVADHWANEAGWSVVGVTATGEPGAGRRDRTAPRSRPRCSPPGPRRCRSGRPRRPGQPGHGQLRSPCQSSGAEVLQRYRWSHRCVTRWVQTRDDTPVTAAILAPAIAASQHG